jgi:hypothetical protein
MALRICYIIILFVSTLFMPFWATCVLGLCGIFYFRTCIEVPFAFLLGDLLYAGKEVRYHNILFVSFLTACVVLLIAEYVKTQLIAKHL